MSTKTVCECGHAIHEHTYSEDYSGCDVPHCNCSLDLGGLIDKQSAELATAKARAKTAEENWHKNEARVAKLLESIKAAQVELHATQRNWDEECLFECNDILTAALKGVA